MKDKLTIGWKEIIDLPELGLFNIAAKTDTGAGTSVLHCESLKVLIKDKQKHIQCQLIVNYETHDTIQITLPVYKVKTIKSSFGQSEKRYIVLTKIRLFNQLFDIKLSFRNRTKMAYPMLLGRNFIQHKFLVDVAKSNLSKKAIR